MGSGPPGGPSEGFDGRGSPGVLSDGKFPQLLHPPISIDGESAGRDSEAV